MRIDCDGISKRLVDVAEPWQVEDFKALDDSWMRVAGLSNKAGYTLAYIERPRGHDKTNGIAIPCLFCLYGSQRRIRGVAAAGDEDQAGFLKDKVTILLDLNPWLRESIELQRKLIVNKVTGSCIQIITSDAATAYGETADLIVCDELTHWKKSDLWEALFSTWAKRAACVLMVIANAGLGMGTSWQWRVREMFREQPEAYFSRLEGPIASWINPEKLALERHGMPAKAYRRLWLNEWVTDSGDALDMQDVHACVTAPGPMIGRESPWECYVTGVDLGIKHDRAAVVTIAIDPARYRVRVASCQSWKPSGPENRIQIMEVEQAVIEQARRFCVNGVACDPWQMERTMEGLRQIGIRAVGVSFNSPKNTNVMVSMILQLFRSRAIELYDHPELINDLAKLQIVDNKFGYKLQAPTDEFGHADTAFALAIAMTAIPELMSQEKWHDDGLEDAIAAALGA